jgi:hypothetical protein
MEDVNQSARCLDPHHDMDGGGLLQIEVRQIIGAHPQSMPLVIVEGSTGQVPEIFPEPAMSIHQGWRGCLDHGKRTAMTAGPTTNRARKKWQACPGSSFPSREHSFERPSGQKLFAARRVFYENASVAG